MNLHRCKSLCQTATRIAGGAAARLRPSKYVCTESASENMMADRYRELHEGQILRKERSFTLSDVRSFCQLCKNTNPIHLQHSSAKQLGFSDCVVPELLYAGLFPAIIGTHFPGSIYVSQRLEFKRPVLVGQHLLAEVRAINLRRVRDKYRVEFATFCWTKIEKFLVVDGTAVAVLANLSLIHKT